MVLGIILIIAGILIAVYPQLLSMIVTMVLIFAGIFFYTWDFHSGEPLARLMILLSIFSFECDAQGARNR